MLKLRKSSVCMISACRNNFCMIKLQNHKASRRLSRKWRARLRFSHKLPLINQTRPILGKQLQGNSAAVRFPVPVPSSESQGVRSSPPGWPYSCFGLSFPADFHCQAELPDYPSIFHPFSEVFLLYFITGTTKKNVCVHKNSSLHWVFPRLISVLSRSAASVPVAHLPLVASRLFN